MLQTAQDALARRDASAALAAVRAVLDAEPELADAHHLHGLALQLAGDFDGAAAALARAAELAPEQAAFPLAEASLALAARRPDVAEQALERALTLDPNLLPAYALRAHVAISQGRLDDAEAQLKRAERLAAEHPLTLCISGNLALARGDHGAAQRALHAAAERAPDEPMVVSSLALAYVAAGNHAFAEQALRRALELEPAALPMRRLLIGALRRQQRVEDLPAELETLLAQAPQDREALALLGDTLLTLGQHEAAVDAYRRLLAAPGVPANTFDAVLGMLGQAGQWQAVRTLLDERLAATPDAAELHQRRLALAGPDEADALIEAWFAARPDDPRALEARAQLNEERGELEAAEADADAALAAEPDLPGAALVKLRAELRSAPERALERVAALLDGGRHAPLQPLLLRIRAFALDRLGRHAEAAEALAEAARLIAPELQLPTARAALDEPPQPEPELAPRLLWTPPGSRVEAVLGLLRGAEPPLHVLDDRFGAAPRPDGLWPPRGDQLIAAASGWVSTLAEMGLTPEQVVDWLPVYDPLIASALPHARLLVLAEDPRDLLLNWLAFGSVQGPAPDPATAAGWLAEALAPTIARLGEAPERTLWLDPNRPAAEAASAVQTLFDLPAAPDPTPLSAQVAGVGALPSRFPAGHWQHYADAPALAAAFARLAEVARQLGY